jgi:hypothetical protein
MSGISIRSKEDFLVEYKIFISFFKDEFRTMYEWIKSWTENDLGNNQTSVL